MPQLLPFAGLRPDPGVVGSLDDVVCPPYDVINEQHRLELLGRSPYNVVRIELPAGRYQQAAALLAEWKSSGVLTREDSPALYGYRMSYRAPTGERRCTVGVIGALVLEPPGRGVLPHELTTPKAKSDRLELLRATNTNTSPIWCLCPGHGLAAALGPVPEEPACVATDSDGSTHELWPVPGPPAHRAVAEVIGAGPLLIADGHHRYETALAYKAESDLQRGPGSQHAGPQHTGPQHAGLVAGAVMVFVVELSDDHLQILGIHRLVSALPAGTDLLGAFGSGFDVTPARTEGTALLAEMSSVGAVGIVTAHGAFLAAPRPGATAPPGTGQLGSTRVDLDSTRVDTALGNLPPHELGYEHDVARALAAVGSGDADAAVFCRPATVAQIAATARGGDRMPPKTTFFWPKPLTGMVMRDW
jgi:uncharacterized protein (DUF1015 family)